MEDRIRQLIKKDNTESAIAELLPVVKGMEGDLCNDLDNYLAELARNKKERRRGLISVEEESKVRARIRLAVLEMLEEIPDQIVNQGVPTELPEPGSRPPSVFISYNHGDSKVADKLKEALEKNGIVVRIDKAVMEAGASIQGFIESSIRETDVTLSIVSNRSLLSAWVALETIGTFHHEKFANTKKFIACYIDDDFFRPEFRLNATKQIDSKIKEIDELIPEHMALTIDTNDLNGQKTRLFRLRNDLGDILDRLRGSLCVDIREDKFDEGVEQIVRAIKSNGSVA